MIYESVISEVFIRSLLVNIFKHKALVGAVMIAGVVFGLYETGNLGGFSKIKTADLSGPSTISAYHAAPDEPIARHDRDINRIGMCAALLAVMAAVAIGHSVYHTEEE